MINTILTRLDIAAPLIALCFALFRREKKLGEHAFIVAYLLIQVITNSISKYLLNADMENILVYQLNTILSVIILSGYFLVKFRRTAKPIYFKALTGISIATVIITLFTLYTEDKSEFNSRSASLVALVMSLYSLLYYYSTLLNPVAGKITGTRSFWFITGIFIYYACSFFIFSTYRLLTEAHSSGTTFLWKIHNVFVLLMCICLSIGFTCRKYRETSSR